jgi:hypothetical protein
MLRPKARPVLIDCLICRAKMKLTAVEPGAHRTVLTYRCPSAHLQELVITSLDVQAPAGRRRILPFGLAWLGRATWTLSG